jgi:amino acid transporter
VALLNSYAYLKLTLRFPGEGGTVEFLNRAFGDGLVAGTANILLLSYVVLLAVCLRLRQLWRPEPDRGFWLHVLSCFNRC